MGCQHRNNDVLDLLAAVTVAVFEFKCWCAVPAPLAAICFWLMSVDGSWCLAQLGHLLCFRTDRSAVVVSPKAALSVLFDPACSSIKSILSFCDRWAAAPRHEAMTRPATAGGPAAAQMSLA
jgi:hypothetical protein